MGCHFFLQGMFLTQGLNPHLWCFLQWQADSLPPHHQGSPMKVSQAKRKMDREWIRCSHKEKHLCAETHLHGCWVLKTRPSVHSLEDQDLDKEAGDWLCVNTGEMGPGGWSQRDKKERQQSLEPNGMRIPEQSLIIQEQSRASVPRDS